MKNGRGGYVGVVLRGMIEANGRWAMFPLFLILIPAGALFAFLILGVSPKVVDKFDGWVTYADLITAVGGTLGFGWGYTHFLNLYRDRCRDIAHIVGDLQTGQTFDQRPVFSWWKISVVLVVFFVLSFFVPATMPYLHCALQLLMMLICTLVVIFTRPAEECEIPPPDL